MRFFIFLFRWPTETVNCQQLLNCTSADTMATTAFLKVWDVFRHNNFNIK